MKIEIVYHHCVKAIKPGRLEAWFRNSSGSLELLINVEIMEIYLLVFLHSPDGTSTLPLAFPKQPCYGHQLPQKTTMD